VLDAVDASEFDAAFATAINARAGGLVISGEALFIGNATCRTVPRRHDQIALSIHPNEDCRSLYREQRTNRSKWRFAQILSLHDEAMQCPIHNRW
jgi:hypothetical protein